MFLEHLLCTLLGTLGASSGTYNELDAKFSNEEDSVGDHNGRGD